LIQLVVDLTNDYYYIKVDLPFFNLFNLFNVFNKVEKISETIEVIELNYLIEKDESRSVDEFYYFPRYN